MVNLEWTCDNERMFYCCIYLKVNLDLEKNKSAWWIFTQLYFCSSESLLNCFGKKGEQMVNLYPTILKGESRWRLEEGEFKIAIDTYIDLE